MYIYTCDSIHYITLLNIFDAFKEKYKLAETSRFCIN